MPITYTIDADAGVIFEVWAGAITAGDLGDYWRAYLADPAVLAVRRTLADLRAADLRFTGAELQALVNREVVPRLGGKTWRTAILVSGPVQFGVSRQYGVFAEAYSRDAIFSDRDAALRWLLGRE